MAAPGRRKIVDKIDLALFVGPKFALIVLSDTNDRKLKDAVGGGVSAGKQEGIGKRDGSAEIIQSVLTDNSLVAIVHPPFVADFRSDHARGADRSRVH